MTSDRGVEYELGHMPQKKAVHDKLDAPRIDDRHNKIHVGQPVFSRFYDCDGVPSPRRQLRLRSDGGRRDPRAGPHAAPAQVRASVGGSSSKKGVRRAG